MNKKLLVVALIILILGGWWYSRGKTTSPATPGLAPQASPSPTPLPKIEVNSSTNLQELNKSLTPRDFTNDYQELKNQAKQIN